MNTHINRFMAVKRQSRHVMGNKDNNMNDQTMLSELTDNELEKYVRNRIFNIKSALCMWKFLTEKYSGIRG